MVISIFYLVATFLLETGAKWHIFQQKGCLKKDASWRKDNDRDYRDEWKAIPRTLNATKRGMKGRKIFREINCLKM